MRGRGVTGGHPLATLLGAVLGLMLICIGMAFKTVLMLMKPLLKYCFLGLMWVTCGIFILIGKGLLHLATTMIRRCWR